MNYIIPLLATAATAAIAQSAPTSTASVQQQRSLVVQGQQGPVTATQASLSVQLADGRFVRIYMLYEPQNGYVWWEERPHPPGQAWLRWVTGHLMSFTNRAITVPDIGLVYFGATAAGIGADIFTMRASSLDVAQQRIVANLNGDGDSARASPPPRRVHFEVDQALGGDCFMRPGHAEVGNPASVLSVAYTNQMFVVNLKSGLVRARAVVRLDREFNLLSATRSPE